MITRSNPEGVFTPTGNYHHVVRVDLGSASILYLAGQIGIDSKGKVVGKTVSTQAMQAFDNIKTIVESEGGTLDNVTELVAYLTDIKGRAGYRIAHSDYFRGNFPAHTLLVVKELARPELLIEIKATAVIANINNENQNESEI